MDVFVGTLPSSPVSDKENVYFPPQLYAVVRHSDAKNNDTMTLNAHVRMYIFSRGDALYSKEGRQTLKSIRTFRLFKVCRGFMYTY